MSEENKETENPQEVDLSQLSNIEFATAWTPSSSIRKDFGDKKREKKGNPRHFHKKGKRSDFGRETRDGNFDRPRQRQKFDGGRESLGGKPRAFAKSPHARKQQPFVFTMEVLFYPDDTPFNKLSDIMKNSKRTYQLFDIAELVLEKNDRFIVLAKNLPDESGAVKPLYCAQPLNLPFEDEAAAKAAAVEYYIDEMFEKCQVQVDPPKGNFQVVNRCKPTGDLLGPPNWHKYNEYLREYHRLHFPKMPFGEFASSIESTRDPELVAAWTEQMKMRDVYKLKNPQEGENDTFDTREAASNYVLHKMGAELVKTYEQVRMRGVNLSKLPFGRIRRNIEEAWRKQKRFPIVTANNLRGRLRRSGFSVYKRGSKGFAFVSIVKRKFLFEGDKLADTPQRIFDFISENPGTIAADLPYKFLGLTPPDEKPKTKTLAEENKDGGNESDKEPATAPNEISEDQKAKLSSVWSELLWLVSEGYVVEYADSTLQANPYLPRPKDKSSKAAEGAENSPADDEPIETQTNSASDAEKSEENCDAHVQQEPDTSEVSDTPKISNALETSCAGEQRENIPNESAIQKSDAAANPDDAPKTPLNGIQGEGAELSATCGLDAVQEGKEQTTDGAAHCVADSDSNSTPTDGALQNDKDIK